MSSNLEDPQWTKLCDQLSRSLRNVGKHTQLLKRATDRLDERKQRDLQNAKGKLGDIMETSAADVATVQSTLSALATYMRLHPATHKGPVQRMAAEARGVIKEYEESHRGLLKSIQSLGGGQKISGAGAGAGAGAAQESAGASSVSVSPEKEAQPVEEDRMARFRSSSYGVGSGKKQPLSKRFAVAAQSSRDEDDDEDDDPSDSKGLLVSHHQQQQQQLVHEQQEDFEQQLHNEVMRERKKDVAEIAENLADIKDIFDHINLLVGEQGEALDVVEKNVETTVIRMEAGNEELNQPRRHVKKSNQRTMWLALVAFLLVMALGAIVFKFTS